MQRTAEHDQPCDLASQRRRASGASGPLLADGVRIAEGIRFGAQVVVHEGTVIGEGCSIEDHTVLGKRPRLAFALHSSARGEVGGLQLAARVSVGTGAIVRDVPQRDLLEHWR